MISPRSGGKVSGITRSDSHFGQINMTRDSLSVRISSSVRERTVVARCRVEGHRSAWLTLAGGASCRQGREQRRWEFGRRYGARVEWCWPHPFCACWQPFLAVSESLRLLQMIKGFRAEAANERV